MWEWSFLLLCSCTAVFSADILVVVPVPSKSHVLLFEPLVLELARRGHKVTYFSAHKLPEAHPNVTDMPVPIGLYTPDGQPMDFLKIRNQSIWRNILDFPVIGLSSSEQLLQNSKFQDFLHRRPKFDLLIHEAFVSEGLIAGLSRHFQIPFIGYATLIPSAWINYMVGNVAPSALIPEPFSGNQYPMDFWGRLINFLYVHVSNINHYLFYLPKQDALMRKYFGDNHPYVKDIIQNMSVLFVNDHLSTSFPRPSVPNMVGIGGLHVTKPKPLPQHLQTFIDNSKKGVILFSLGSNIKASLMSTERLQVFINAFSKLEQNVLWKFEDDIPNPPKNVLISKWLPQSDVLAHPNVKLFITHGGLLSTTEAIDRGVPIVGIPIFGDQPTNMAMSVNYGVGVSLQFDQLTSEALYSAIQEVLNNPRYREATRQRSRRYHDRILSPMDLAIWWIEYVIRHNGAHHLRSAGLDQTWYEAQQLDVLLALILAIAIPILIVRKILCGICKLLSSKSKVSKKQKRN